VPWVPKKDALRKQRELAHYTCALLARRAGISDRQLRKIESDNPPGSIFGSNLYALTSILGCAKEDLATWVSPRELRSKAPARAKQRARKRRKAASSSSEISFDELVDLERQFRLQGELEDRVATPLGEFALLGAERMAECLTHFGAYDGQRFAALGLIEQHKPLTFSMAKALGVETGQGARFKLGRLIAYDISVDVTVFTASAENTRKMLELARENKPVTVIARVHVARLHNKWKGFVNLEGDGEPVPFAFVVDDIISPTDL
jgi:transcriptional regulator with XRE-family HTH domain